MQKTYTLIRPDIEFGTGRVSSLIDELKSCEDGGADEIRAALSVLTDTNELTSFFGPKTGGAVDGLVAEFRSFLSERAGSTKNISDRIMEEWCWEEISLHVGAFSSATGAIYAALTAAGVGGGEVITTSLNYVGVVNAVLLAGAFPKFVDVDPKTLCMAPGHLPAAITEKTKAVILTHVNCFADIEPFYDAFKEHGYEFPLIQDASLAIGSTSKGLRPGLVNIGPNGASVFSLAVSKIITGLGGALATSHNAGFLDSMREIAHQGMSSRDGTYVSSMGGANFKMGALNAAIALAMLKRREKIFGQRRKLKALYDAELAHLVSKGLLILPEPGPETVITHYPVILNAKRDNVAAGLAERFCIQVGSWYVHHKQPLYEVLLGADISKLPRSEKLNDRLMFLPFHTGLDGADVAYICSALMDILSVKSPSSRHPRKSTHSSKR